MTCIFLWDVLVFSPLFWLW